MKKKYYIDVLIDEKLKKEIDEKLKKDKKKGEEK